MAELMFTSETGMFHSACCCTYSSGAPAWYGFVPAKKSMPISAGKVDRKNRKSLINHYITFSVKDLVLKRAVTSVANTYSKKQYILCSCDCVSFSADVARLCGLRVPKINLTPYGFIEVLSWWNSYIKFK